MMQLQKTGAAINEANNLIYESIDDPMESK
jgi:hypothetical protein